MAKPDSGKKSPAANPEYQGHEKPPMTPGQLGMWVFISTEVMLFAAIITTYLIFRLSNLQSDWPGSDVMHVSMAVGIVNTLILVISGVTAWATHQAAKEDRPSAAKLWLTLTILLGLTFMGIKSWEYHKKYQVGLLPISSQKQYHNQADFEYLANVNLRLKDSIAELESKVGDVTNDSAESEKMRERLELLYSLKKYMAGETSRNAGRNTTTYYSLLSINMMAYQIYPHVDTGRNVEVVLEPEFAALARSLATNQERLDLVKRRSEMVKMQVQQIDAELEPFRILAPTGEEAVAFEKMKAWLETKKDQQKELLVESKRISALLTPQQGRMDNLVSSFAFDEGEGEDSVFKGVNDRHDVRLPVVIPSGQAWISCYLLLTGTHAIHLIGGLLVLIWWLPRKLNSQRSPALFVTCMYWQFVDAVWLAIFWLIYL